jgi:hypothetical protein
MKLHSVSGTDLAQVPSSTASVPYSQDSQSFEETLKAATLEHSNQQAASESAPASSSNPLSPPLTLSPQSPEEAGPSFRQNAAAAYEQQANHPNGAAPISDLQKYKDDQLLRNPGGKHYYLDKKEVVEHPEDQDSFLGRIKKDLSDSFGNVLNFFGNLFFGSKILYRDQNNQIQEAQQRGLIGTLVNFVKDLGSALSFGLWHPDEDQAPQGFMNRLVYSAGKLKDALLTDLIEGVPASVNHMGQNLLLAGWNLIEVLPDASIGNFEEGQKLTTTVFDNGQVVVEYLTDIIPSGDAWLRAHAANLKEVQPPFIYNLKMPEHYSGDTRWEYVRNTPLRKSIESVGALLADVGAIALIGMTAFSSNRDHPVR